MSAKKADDSTEGKKTSGSPAQLEKATLSRMELKYRNEILPALMKERGFGNILQAPRLEKVVINMGLGKAVQNQKIIDSAVEDLAKITGQKPVIRRSRKAIANFKLREGLPIGVSVTLRKRQMWEFVDRLINVALPRVRDFRGIPRNAFDGRGNYSMGLQEQIIFPEIDMEKTEIKGMGITFVTSARNDQDGEILLEKLGMPFRKQTKRRSESEAAGELN